MITSKQIIAISEAYRDSFISPYKKGKLAVIYENLAHFGKLLGYEVTHRFYEIGSFQGINDLTKYLISKTR